MEQDEVEAWASLSLNGLRRYPDPDLLAELDYTRREIAECKPAGDTGDYLLMQTRRVWHLEEELNRRRVLAEFGGPAVRQPPPDFHQRMEHIKAGIDIVGIADLLGIPTGTLPRNGRLAFRCPAHGDGTDRSPSGVLYLDQWRWWCYGCSAGGSGFDLVIAFRQADTFWEAVEWLEKFLPPLPSPARATPKPTISFQKVIPDQ